MSLLPLRKVRPPLGNRQPTDEPSSIGAWIKKELWGLLRVTIGTINWAVDFLGKVQVDSTDEPSVLETKLVNSATVTWTKAGAVGARTLSATASGWSAPPLKSTMLPLPNGVAALGNEGKWADGQHVHPSTTIATAAVFCGAQQDSFFGWTEGPTGTWTKNALGSISGIGWADGNALATGNRIFIADHVTESTLVQGVIVGIYDIVEVGSGSAYAQVRRSSDADQDGDFFAGMSVLVEKGTDGTTPQTWFLLNPPIDVDTTEQRWGMAPGGGTSAHTHHWDHIEPVGTATFPMPMLTIVDGKLTLGEGNFFAVDPDENTLDQISVPVCGAYETVPITLVFTGPVEIRNQQVPDSGFATILSTTNGLYLPADWSSITCVWLGGQWVVTSERIPE